MSTAIQGPMGEDVTVTMPRGVLLFIEDTLEEREQKAQNFESRWPGTRYPSHQRVLDALDIVRSAGAEHDSRVSVS